MAVPISRLYILLRYSSPCKLALFMFSTYSIFSLLPFPYGSMLLPLFSPKVLLFPVLSYTFKSPQEEVSAEYLSIAHTHMLAEQELLSSQQMRNSFS